jgi:hypothetical protein
VSQVTLDASRPLLISVVDSLYACNELASRSRHKIRQKSVLQVEAWTRIRITDALRMEPRLLIAYL